LREFEPDVAPADDDQMTRQRIEVEHRRVREVRDAVDPGPRWDRSAAADVDEDLVGAEELFADPNAVRRLEASLALDDGASIHPTQPRLDAMPSVASTCILPCLDPLHVDADRSADEHAVVARPSRDVGRTRARDERLGRHAAGVHARTAEELSL